MCEISIITRGGDFIYAMLIYINNYCCIIARKLKVMSPEARHKEENGLALN